MVALYIVLCSVGLETVARSEAGVELSITTNWYCWGMGSYSGVLSGCVIHCGWRVPCVKRESTGRVEAS